jgi:hypothetical protein
MCDLSARGKKLITWNKKRQKKRLINKIMNMTIKQYWKN